MITVCTLSLKQDGPNVLLPVIIHPHARRDAVIDIHDNSLRIDIKDAPEKGAANAAVIRFLASVFSKSRSEIDIRHGHTSRRKLLVLYNCVVCDIMQILTPLIKERAKSNE
jgi:uncharacterized protein (TIGR00251 family)